MSGKHAPELVITTQEVAEAFKRSGLPVHKFTGFDEGYRLGARLRAEACFLESQQSPVTHVEIAS